MRTGSALYNLLDGILHFQSHPHSRKCKKYNCEMSLFEKLSTTTSELGRQMMLKKLLQHSLWKIKYAGIQNIKDYMLWYKNI